MYLNYSKKELAEGLNICDLESPSGIFITKMNSMSCNAIELFAESGIIRNNIQQTSYRPQSICNTLNIEMPSNSF